MVEESVFVIPDCYTFCLCYSWIKPNKEESSLTIFGEVVSAVTHQISIYASLLLGTQNRRNRPLKYLFSLSSKFLPLGWCFFVADVWVQHIRCPLFFLNAFYGNKPGRIIRIVNINLFIATCDVCSNGGGGSVHLDFRNKFILSTTKRRFNCLSNDKPSWGVNSPQNFSLNSFLTTLKAFIAIGYC